MKHWSKSKLQDQNGASTVEYALLIAVIVLGVIGAASLMFTPLETFFKGVIKLITDKAGVK